MRQENRRNRKTTEERIADEIGRQERRKKKAREEGEDRSFWFGLGMFGLVGWSVAVPTLLLTALGIWLDTRFGTGIRWTLTFIVIGIAIGSANAWYWIKRESRHD